MVARSRIFLVCALVGLSGCGKGTNPPDPGCAADEDCPPGNRCEEGKCLAGCRTSQDCDLSQLACAGGPCDPACAVAECDRESGLCLAVARNQGRACDDGDACTTGDVCLAGACTPAGELACDDGDICTADRCQAGLGCIFEPRDCDDGLWCTHDGCLADYGCAHLPREGYVVVDGECLTEGETDPGPCGEVRDGYIVDLPDGTPCEDSSSCTEDTLCRAGACVGGRPVQCLDGDPTTTDTCSTLSGCLHDEVCDEFQVNLVSQGRQEGVRAVSFPQGGGVVAWQTWDVSSSHVMRISFRLFGQDGVPAGDEVEVLPPTEVEQVYGAWAGLGSVARVGSDGFAIAWNLGTQGQGLYRIYDRYGSPVTDELILPEPLLPEPLGDGEVLLAQRLLAHEPLGFVVLMHNRTSPAGPNEGTYLYRFDDRGRLQVGPVETDLVEGDYGRLILSGGDGTFQVFLGGFGAFTVRRYDSGTLLPAADPVTVVAVTSHPHLLSDARQTPWGPVVAASNVYDGSWLYWLDPDGNRQATTTLATVSGDTANLQVGLATWGDGRALAVVANNSQPNGMSMHRFTGRGEQISGIFSLDCAGVNHNTYPRLIRLGDALALAVWSSTVSDGDLASIRGRYVSW